MIAASTRASPNQLVLKEWVSQPARLTESELRAIQALGAGITVEPFGEPGTYMLTPGSVIGAVRAGPLNVVITPKLDSVRVLYMLGFGGDGVLPADEGYWGIEKGLVDAVAAVYSSLLSKALRRGLLMGYRTYEEALPSIRGRILFDAQARRRFGLLLPTELRYDDYTVDTEPNRLLKAALRRLLQLPLGNAKLRERLRELSAQFAAVSDVRFTASTLPQVQASSRLTRHFDGPLRLAELVIRNTSIELLPGETGATGMLFDMNRVFEDFVFEALRRRIHEVVPGRRWEHHAALSLDEAGELRLEPDLSLWNGNECSFVGDAKYKRTRLGSVDDVYQMLAYCIATDLPSGLLIYAEGPPVTVEHQVVHGGPRIQVATLAVSGSVPELNASLDALALMIQSAAGVSAHAVAP